MVGVLEKHVSKLNISLSELQSSVYTLQGKVHSLSERTGSGGGGQAVHQSPTLPVTSSSSSIPPFIPKNSFHTHIPASVQKNTGFSSFASSSLETADSLPPPCSLKLAPAGEGVGRSAK